MRYVPLTPKVYFGNVVTGSWDTVFGLRDAGAEFLLLIRKDDRIGKLIHSAVANFLAHQRVFLYVVQVFVDRDPAAADYLAAAMVPQLRYYRDGVERGRHRGVADYNAITTLLVVE
jgi:hypothetical protein